MILLGRNSINIEAQRFWLVITSLSWHEVGVEVEGVFIAQYDPIQRSEDQCEPFEIGKKVKFCE